MSALPNSREGTSSRPLRLGTRMLAFHANAPYQEDSTIRYAFDNAWQKGQERLHSLEALLDPGTIRHLDALGVARGWLCLEVGTGADSITRWLCLH